MKDPLEELLAQEKEKEVLQIIKTIIRGLHRTVDSQRELIKISNRTIELIRFLKRSIMVAFFVISLLAWKVFLLNPFNTLLNKFGEGWVSLSENYKILILNFIGAIIAGIIAHIVGSLLLEKIKNILQITQKCRPGRKHS